MAPAMDASWFLLSTPLPAKYAAPPWLTCRIIGAFASRAASRAATAVEDEVTLMAGMAKTFSWAYLKSFLTSSTLLHC